MAVIYLKPAVKGSKCLKAILPARFKDTIGMTALRTIFAQTPTIIITTPEEAEKYMASYNIIYPPVKVSRNSHSPVINLGPLSRRLRPGYVDAAIIRLRRAVLIQLWA
jgi:hypothetical protein